MSLNRRTFIAGAGAVGAATDLLAPSYALASVGQFPQHFLWGSATSGHQIEGNNVISDSWLLEHVKPTVFREPSGDAANSLELWPVDLDLVKQLGLNSYRFSLEWSRIEPEEGTFSLAMLEHYKKIVEGCRDRGLTPVVTFNHYTVPVWFSKAGAWTNTDAPAHFARFCERAAKHLGSAIGRATTLNEPNIAQLLHATLPELAQSGDSFREMLAAANRATGSRNFQFGMFVGPDSAARSLSILIAAHKAGRAAIKAAVPHLPVGVSIAMTDEQAVGSTEKRDIVRQEAYGAWFDAVRGDDFVGVQNYTRNIWGEKGKLPVPAKAIVNSMGSEVYPPSLAGAVRYAHEASGCPVLVTEHGVATEDDTVRANLISAALKHLKAAIDEGVPVLGYIHWSLMDNFEWTLGYGPKFGLCSLDRMTFRRSPKPSAYVLGGIARRNAV